VRTLVGAKVDDRLDQADDRGRHRDGVVPRQRLDPQGVVRGLGSTDQRLRLEPRALHLRARLRDLHLVRAGRAVDDNRVGRAVAGAAQSGQIDIGRLGVGAGEVVDRDRIRAGERVNGDPLDLVQVIVTLAMSRENRIRWPFADTSMFSLMFAVEIEGVRAVLALDGVAALARVPVERVVVLAQQCEEGGTDGVGCPRGDSGCGRSAPGGARCRRKGGRGFGGVRYGRKPAG
jgi:hypothetical protein